MIKLIQNLLTHPLAVKFVHIFIMYWLMFLSDHSIYMKGEGL